MNGSVRWRCCAALVALATTNALAGEDAFRFEEGVARNPSTSTVMYREQHWTRSKDDKLVERLVLYRCPDGTAFARKHVDYRGSAISPAFAFEDRRSGHREGLRRNARPTLFFQAPGQSGERLAVMKSDSLVADAGFDEFVRRQWSALLAGRSMPLDFALPSRLRSLPFSVRRQGQAVIAGEKAWVFRLKLDGWLGLVAPSIDVSYGQASRRLLRFQGLSNLRDDAGKDQLLARIDFPAPATVSDESRWQSAAATPLSACRTGR